VLKALVHVAWGFVVEQVIAKVGKRREEGRVVKVVYEATTVVAVKWPRNWKELAATFMESLVVAREKPEMLKRYESAEAVEGQRRRRRLDKFLKFYVAFELLAAALGYRWRCNKEWAYAGGAMAP